MLGKEKENLIFGLDIGTRTIIGIVGYKQGKQFFITATEVIEHESRAMVDGQIHDILVVARSAKKLKKRLEDKIGMKLEEVSIAAAGRVLKTVKVNVTQKFNEPQIINGFIIKGLELQGIQEAQQQIPDTNLDDQEEGYFYVGHSVINYYLNGYTITSLEEQKGKEVGADILATFLPKVVVDSLYTVMDKIGLKVNNITLEPIAAMNAVIPHNLRLLNLALVDIGAGTSDIAITKEGSVTAYGMIPIAGDEITEKLLHTYLVDFKTAENIKQQLATTPMIQFQDIIGISHEIPAEDIKTVIKDVIERLGTEIASKIIELNGHQSANAVFCVGGASQTPYITEILAQKLSIALERVSVRTSEHATMVIDPQKQIKGPESITPLGICVTAMEKDENNFINIKVNNKLVKLLRTKKLTVADAVIAIDLDHTQIISVRGKTLMFRLNKERIRVKGEVGNQPVIMVNNKEASLETSISDGDELNVYPAQNGEDGQMKMLDLIGQIGLTKEKANIVVNGKKEDHTYQIKNGDEITITEIKEIEIVEEKMIYVTVNGQAVAIPYQDNLVFVKIFDYIDFDLSTPKGNIVLKLNGDRASYTDILKDGDQVDIYWE